jgi:hypothetical protein
MAERWGVPPWEVTGEQPPERVIWYLRQMAYSEELGRARRAKKEQGRHG